MMGRLRPWLAAMGASGVPDKAPDAYVSTLFDQHAGIFEIILVNHLDYCVPIIARDAFDRTRSA